MRAGGASPQDDFSAAEWELVKDLVDRCHSDPPDDPDRFLAEQQASPKVRKEVKRLLRVSPEVTGFLAESATEKHLGVKMHQPLRIGKYRVMDQIGSGGSGVVYSAWDEALNRKVAVKVLRPEAAGDPESRKRLRWDARAASALQHPNIVVVYEVGSDGGIDYVAMECIAGQTLAERIHGMPLDNREVLGLAIQICSGLEAAHASGIVHRDLKPGNIMITEQGVVKILDFGLAKHFDSGIDAKDAPETVEGRFAGTVAYVSPEQADAKPVDARSDIFSFGSVLYEMLTGRQAFPGSSTVSVLADIMLTNPRPVQEVASRVAPGFQEILTRCMRKDRERRFQSIAEVRVRLRELEDQILHPETDATVILPAVSERRPARRSRAAWAAWAAAALLLGAGGMWLFLRNSRPSDQDYVLARITADRGFTGYPALSRDGTLLAYASDRGNSGNLDIFVQHTNSNDARQFTHHPANDYDPVFSPDGSTLIFRSDRDGGGLYSMPTLGGTEHLLVRDGRHARFSPDGRWIAYSVGDGRASFKPGSVHVFVIPAYGGVPEQLVPDFAAAGTPVWSPDGARILFLGRRSQDSVSEPPVWYTAPFHSNGPVKETGLNQYLRAYYLGHLPLEQYPEPSTWLPDGTLILSGRQGDASNVWGIRLNTDGKPHGEPRRLTAGTTIEWHASTGTAGSNHLLAYESMTFDSGIWEVTLDAQSRPAGPPHLLLSGYHSMASSSVSADGRRVVFSSKPPAQFDARESIRLMELNSGKGAEITRLFSRTFTRPIVSGDGKSVVYRDENQAFVISVDGGAAQPISDGHPTPTHLSYDGSAVLLESGEGRPDQILYVTRGHAPVPLVALDPPRFTMQSGARFSPDNRWIVFASGNASSPTRQIFVAPLRPGTVVTPAELIPITDGTQVDVEPFWSLDGKTIFFVSRRDGFNCVWAQHVNDARRPDGAPYEIAPFHQPESWLGSSDVYSGDIGLSAGPRSLIFTAVSATSDVWVKSDYSLFH